MARPCSFMEITPAIIGNHSSDIRSTHGQTDRHKDTTRLVRFRTQPDSTTRLDHRYIWTQPDRSAQLDTSGHNPTDQHNLIHLDTTWQISPTWYIWTQPDRSAQLDISGHNLTDQPNLIHLDTTWQIRPTWYVWTQPDRSAQLEHRYICAQPDRSAQLTYGNVFYREQPLWTPCTRK
jgi:hypothetical protein